MKLLTEVALPAYPFSIDHRSSILMLGSCFTETIGKQLERNLFRVCINPFGVIYNPLSVKKGLDSLLHKTRYTEDDLDQYDDLWFSFDHYTLFSSKEREEVLNRINQRFIRARELMRGLHLLILTWGTAWVYTHRKSGRVVCNCHKIPAAEFTRSRLTPDEIIEAYDRLLPSLFSLNPDMNILFTISPVRHWKDGAHENQLSKSALLLAEDALRKKYSDRVHYFPSYEIVMDELRDYRFYAGDMLHPGEQATRYIWEKFGDALLSPSAKNVIGEVDPVVKMFEHRIMTRDPEKIRELTVQREKKLEILKNKYPDLAWENLDELPV